MTDTLAERLAAAMIQAALDKRFGKLIVTVSFEVTMQDARLMGCQLISVLPKIIEKDVASIL